MSTLVTNELFAQPGRGDDVANLLIEILGESLQHEGCETIRIVRDQDDPDHVAGFTQWTERRNFEDYLAWRTERGFTGTFEAMLTRPFVIHYYDIAYFGEGVAARQSIQPQRTSQQVPHSRRRRHGRAGVTSRSQAGNVRSGNQRQPLAFRIRVRL
jgi:quinol monooxygenase YgiN